MKCEKNRCRNLAAAACAAFAGAAFASVTVDSGVATANVASGVEYTLTAEDATKICAADSLVKTGAGVLVADAANASLAAFAGEIRVKEGVYRIASAADLGTADGATVVESGACLEAKIAATVDLGDEPIQLAGNGPTDDSACGALWVNAGQKLQLNALSLEADTAVHVNRNGTLTLNGTVDLDGHTLDIWARGNHANANGSATVKNGGHINMKFLYSNSAAYSGLQFGWTLEGTSDNVITGGGTRGGTACNPSATPWTWVVDSVVGWRVNAQNGTLTDVPDDVLSAEKQFWGGPVELNANVVVGQVRNNGEWQVGGFKGPVSGSGNISVFDPSSTYKTWFKLGSANPNWTGSISAKRDHAVMTYTVNGTTYTTLHHTGIALFADGALTQKTLELQNAELLLAGDDPVQHLPDIVTDGHGRIFGSVKGQVAKVTKTGTHPLSIEAPLAVTNEIVVREGSLVLPSLAAAYAAVTSKYTYAAMNVAGLSETMYIKGADTTNGPTVRAMGPVAGFFDGNNACVDKDVETACKKAGPGYDDNAAWIKNRDDNLVYQYDGYIWNRADSDVTWGFMSCINSESQIWFENAAGELALVQKGGFFSSTNATVAAYKEVTLKPGANRIRICVIGGGGASAGKTVTVDGEPVLCWNKNYPICYDPELDNTLRDGTWSTTCYEPFVNLLDKDGKGALFTTVPEAEADLFAAYGTADERAALQAMLPSFAKATFGAETTLDLNGLPADVPFALDALEGAPRIVGGNLTVKDWTLTAAALNAGTASSESAGRVTFADGARLLIHDRGLKANDAGYPILEAAGGIDGLPELVFLDRPGRTANWKLILSEDGRTLRLAGGTTGLCVIIR